MAKRAIRTRLKREEVKKLVRNLPGILAGSKPSQFGLHKIFWGAVAHSLFTSIQAAFIAKSEKQKDELGNSWDDITQHTKAYKRDVAQGGTDQSLVRRRRQNLSRDRITGERRGLGLLTPGQYKRWRQIFGVIYHNYHDAQGTADDSNAVKRLAAQIAWTRLKEEGAATMWEVLGTRDLLLLRRTEKLFKALTPGEFNPQTGYKKGDRNQVFVLSRGKIVIGVNLDYANYVSAKRPIWPEDIDLWLDRAVEAGLDAVHKRLQEILE